MGEKVRVIARREYLSRVRERSFRISTAIQLLIVLGLAFVPSIIQAIGGDNTEALTVRIVDESGADIAGRLTPYLAEVVGAGEAGAPISLVQDRAGVIDVEAARSEVQSGEIDAALLVSRDAAGDLQFTYVADNGMDTLAQRIYAASTAASLEDRLQRAGLSAAELDAVVRPLAFTVDATNPGNPTESNANTTARLTVANLLALLMYLAVLVYGVWVAQGVVEEKSSRIMEIMVNAATPRELMAGKILGIGLAALTQLVPTIVLSGIAFSLQGWFAETVLGGRARSRDIDFSAISVEAGGWFLLYFLFGFLLYAALYAGVGSLVSRQEEVNQATLPLTLTIMVGYFGAIFTLNNPETLAARILSIVPLTSPVVMVSRVVIGDPAPWELLLSVGLLIVAVVVAVIVAARFYRSGVLMYGQRPSIRALFRPDVVSVAR